MTKLIYDHKALPFILEALGFKKKKGLVVDSTTGERPNGKKIKANKIIAIQKDKVTGQPKFYTNEAQLVGDVLRDKFGPFL